MIGGISKNYIASRSAYYMDFSGFKQEGGQYFLGFIGDRYFDITPKEILNQDIIIVDCNSFKDKCNQTGPTVSVPKSTIAGLINLKDDKFPGLIIVVNKETIEESTLNQILSAFKFVD